ncbi:MAG: hypothetical protein V2A63_02335 [Patescibacteria group bacterium]
MQTAIYIIYGLLLAAFLVFASFAVHHAFTYAYISPRIRVIAGIFIVVSAILIAVSVYLLTQLQI